MVVTSPEWCKSEWKTNAATIAGCCMELVSLQEYYLLD